MCQSCMLRVEESRMCHSCVLRVEESWMCQWRVKSGRELDAYENEWWMHVHMHLFVESPITLITCSS